jgi:transposase
MGRISEDTRNNIISLIDAGLSLREVEAQLGVGQATVSRVRAEARPHAQKRRAGRPAKLTATDKRWLVRKITSRKADNAVQLTRQLRDITNVECSVWAVRRALKEAGLKAAPMKKKAATFASSYPPAPCLRLATPTLDRGRLEARRVV